MDITRRELETLNFYRASELHGGLILGALVRRVRDPQLILDLTRHATEEIAHAQLWTEAMLAVGGHPWPTRDTYQARYAAVLGTPLTILDVLALTQVFERRVYRHFTEHRKRPGTHPVVAATLERMLAEEKGHLLWVKRWLDTQTGTRPEAVREALRRYAAADAVVYRALLVDFGWSLAA